jgi:hypothetical protein
VLSIANWVMLKIIKPRSIAQEEALPMAATSHRESRPNNWIALVKHQDDRPPWQQQYKRHDAQYKYLHDWEIVAARRIKQQAAYHKRRRPVDLCYPSEGRRGAILNLSSLAHHLIPRKREVAYIYALKGRGIGLDFVIGITRKPCQNLKQLSLDWVDYYGSEECIIL